MAKEGLHAVVICSDPSKTRAQTSIKETLRYLDFALITCSLFGINITRPANDKYETISDYTNQLSSFYNFTMVNILMEVVYTDILRFSNIMKCLKYIYVKL